MSGIWGVHFSVSVVLEELCVGSPNMCREFQGLKVPESVGSPDTLLTLEFIVLVILDVSGIHTGRYGRPEPSS